ncbi:MAG: WhiB family transcriptional regulator [Acidimicrobiia bacterium]|nr:WhiB family transcriptional regulator [Acidimicrobiia bacterium]
MDDTVQFDFEWRDLAACVEHDPDLFFPAGETGPAGDQIAAAKRICADCPVALDCLYYAVTTGQRSGVWGGTDENERRMLRRKWVTAERKQVDVDLVELLAGRR